MKRRSFTHSGASPAVSPNDNPGSKPPAPRPDPERDTFLRGQIERKSQLARTLDVSEADADDIVQDAALALLLQPESVRSYSSWFRKTTLFRKLRLLRQEKLARKLEPRLEAHMDDLGSPFPAPDAAAERKVELERLLQKVHPSRREVALCKLAGYDSRRIAKELKLPVNTVKSRWERAKVEMGIGGALLSFLVAMLRWLTKRIRRGESFVRGWHRPPRGAQRALATVLAGTALGALVAGHTAVRSLQAPAPRFTDDTRLAVAPLESYLFRPTIRTYAERELEASPQTSHPGAAETPIDRVEQRGYLDHALSMAQRGYLAGAEDALRLYDIEQRHNPFPSQRARLVALLAKAKSP